MKKALLHVCCAPCMIFPHERMLSQGFSVESFFYNPNIHPFTEYTQRKNAVEGLCRDQGIPLRCPEYDPREFFWQVHRREEPPSRCLACWQLRLERSAREAAQGGFDCFTTTLLVSPYQDQNALARIGEEAAVKYATRFLYEDFRPGFRDAHARAKAAGIYCQKYCGCIYSEMERFAKKK